MVTFTTSTSVSNVDVRAYYGDVKCNNYHSGYRVATLNDVTLWSDGYVQKKTASFRPYEPVIFVIGSSYFSEQGRAGPMSCYVAVKLTPKPRKRYEIRFSEFVNRSSISNIACKLDVLELLQRSPESTLERETPDAEQAVGCRWP